MMFSKHEFRGNRYSEIYTLLEGVNEILLTLSKPSRCVSIQLVYIFTSYTTINIKIYTIKCYKFNGCKSWPDDGRNGDRNM